MSSILNSISTGSLEGRQVHNKKLLKEDPINDLLRKSEIEFKACPKFDKKVNNFNTGFGENQELYYETPCKKPELKTPLYQENYLREFMTEEEKAAARHALGLYNKGDIVAMSLLTAEDGLPSSQDWDEHTVKQLRKGDKFFAPVTSFEAVFDSTGTSLDEKVQEINSLLVEQKNAIVKITQVSLSENISSLGDVALFLEGFKNGDNLHNTLDEMNKEMLRFEKTGSIL